MRLSTISHPVLQTRARKITSKGGAYGRVQARSRPHLALAGSAPICDQVPWHCLGATRARTHTHQLARCACHMTQSRGACMVGYQLGPSTTLIWPAWPFLTVRFPGTAWGPRAGPGSGLVVRRQLVDGARRGARMVDRLGPTPHHVLERLAPGYRQVP